MDRLEIEQEIFLLALKRVTGHDFCHYSTASLNRQIIRLMEINKTDSLLSLLPRILEDQDFCAKLINQLTVSYSELFRDPSIYENLKSHIVNYLKTFQKINIWVAGCAYGEEAYSLAIFLKQQNLLEQTNIYATDISEEVISQASKGYLQIPISDDDQDRFFQATGQLNLADYFEQNNGQHKLNPDLMEHIIFARHDLLQQPSFISSQLIFCRNVFIYFSDQLIETAMSVLDQSLLAGGYLLIGSKDNIQRTHISQNYQLTSKDNQTYQKTI